MIDAAPAAPKQSALAVIALGGIASFCAYFAMYAFRKPFTAASFDDVQGWSFALNFKIALVLAQVFGYALSKIVGVKVISEFGRNRRGVAIVVLIAFSWLALVAFALVPPAWKVVALFANGLPLGLIWGLVFSYLEGRRVSDLLGAILCASFILSSGVVKSVGVWAMQTLHVSEFWMPAVTGALFFPLLLVSVYALSFLPPPSAEDEAARTRREPMRAAERAAFLRRYGLGMAFLVAAYILFTAFRDFRDNFAAEIWRSVGHGDEPAVFSLSEAPVAAISLIALGAMMAIRNNRIAFFAQHVLMALGALAIGAATWAFHAHMIDSIVWMIASGAGLYLAYTPFNAMLFDRLLASARFVGAAGFLIYLADASGYMGSVALLLFKNFGAPNLDWLSFFSAAAYASAALGALFIVASAVAFARALDDEAKQASTIAAPLQTGA